MVNTAVIFHPYFTADYLPMLNLIKARHQTYADQHGFDLLPIDISAVFPGVDRENAQAQMVAVTNDLLQKYDFIAWLDLDTLIWDMSIDLRLATDTTGAVRFQADKPIATPEEMHDFHFGAWHNHLNCGVVYIRRTDFTVKFVGEWLDLAREIGTWYSAQNAYNILSITYGIPELDVRWNYNRNRHGACENPVVRGYHGYMGTHNKMDEIRKDLAVLT